MGRGQAGRGGGAAEKGRRQWASRPGDLWTEHSVIALDPFVFKWSHRRSGGGYTAQDALQ